MLHKLRSTLYWQSYGASEDLLNPLLANVRGANTIPAKANIFYRRRVYCRMTSVHLPVPREFSFARCVEFLQRSPRELLHRVEDDRVVKLLRVGESSVLFSVRDDNKNLIIDWLSGPGTQRNQAHVTNYVREWFDLETDLRPFYALARKDALLKDLVKKYYGYRIIGQPDLFESLVWAVLGQQINLAFAYTLKQRFVEKFGESMVVKNQSYHVFPLPRVVAQLTDADLLPLQFSRQKSKYTVLIAEAFASGAVSKEKLHGLPLQEAKEILMNIKGVGNWTANYALMKTFRYPDAFPLEDAGLHNAIKNLKAMKQKPTLTQVKRIFKNYAGWEAYATL
ncbi:MAG: DNA-3-methyladenine glycosylase, partial [Cyclobacteriaceae bacterium]|nr:DNA-3-methyladenine glycosylase [Cyclobacteriaceae bacterium]